MRTIEVQTESGDILEVRGLHSHVPFQHHIYPILTKDGRIFRHNFYFVRADHRPPRIQAADKVYIKRPIPKS